MKFAEKTRKAGRAFARSFRRHAVYFAAIAGGKDEGFLEDSLRAKLFGGPAGLLGGKGNPLAHLNGRGAVIQSDENDLHARVRALLKKAVVMRKIEIHHRKTEKNQHEIRCTALTRARRATLWCAPTSNTRRTKRAPPG